VADGEAALKDARFPQFAAQIGSPAPRFAAPAASLTAAAPPAAEAPSSIGKTDKETVMTIISATSSGGCEAVVDALYAQFGAVLAARIIESEAVDFLWDARVRERYLGQHFDVWFGDEEGETELARVAILSCLRGRWHVAACLVDGEGTAVDLLWKRTFSSRDEAKSSFIHAR